MAWSYWPAGIVLAAAGLLWATPEPTNPHAGGDGRYCVKACPVAEEQSVDVFGVPLKVAAADECGVAVEQARINLRRCLVRELRQRALVAFDDYDEGLVRSGPGAKEDTDGALRSRREAVAAALDDVELTTKCAAAQPAGIAACQDSRAWRCSGGVCVAARVTIPLSAWHDEPDGEEGVPVGPWMHTHAHSPPPASAAQQLASVLPWVAFVLGALGSTLWMVAPPAGTRGASRSDWLALALLVTAAGLLAYVVRAHADVREVAGHGLVGAVVGAGARLVISRPWSGRRLRVTPGARATVDSETQP